MKIAVTGSNGFIGSNLASWLEFRGQEVVRLVRPSLDEPVSLSKKLKGVQVICHCAWMGHPRNEADNQRNIYTSMVVGKAADIANVDHLIFLSTGGGINNDTAYANSKREVEKLFSKEFGLFNFDLTTLRPSAVYGSGQDPGKGLGAVTTFLNAVMNDKPIHILGSPHSGRDFLHVNDLVECIWAVAAYGPIGTYDVGGPEVVELRDLIAMIEKTLGKTANVQIENPTGNDPQRVQLDNGPITNVTGWTPKISVESWLNWSDNEK